MMMLYSKEGNSLKEIVPGVWFVQGRNKGRFPFAHSVLFAGDYSILVDTGTGRKLDELAGRVDRVFLSHYHRDHVTGNSMFKGAEFRIHSLDAPGVQSPEGFSRLSGFKVGCGSGFWKMFKQEGFDPTPLSGYLEDGQRFDLGSMTLQVLHTPGHTPGHCSFLVEEYELVFLADIDLTAFGPWYGNACSDLEQYRQSIRRICDLKPSCLLTSHRFPVTENIKQKLDGFAAVIEQRDELLCNVLRQRPLTLEELVELKLFFKRHPKPEYVYQAFERNMLLKHLDGLIKQNMVSYDTITETYRAV